MIHQKGKQWARTMLFVLGALALLTPALCEDIDRIYTPSDFIKFVNAVNSGNDYKNKTVFLEAYIDLKSVADQLAPIGKDQNVPFSGTFDGQGYNIGNFVINATEKYAGLFGYSKGSTIRNLIISITCSINIATSGPSSNVQLYAGAVIGRCEKVNNPCKIENTVNLGNVSFSRIVSGELYLGGIAGYIYSRHESHIRNCANYGIVAYTGRSTTASIGGIVGFYSGSTSKSLTISNCLNLGPIYFINKNVNTWYVGGIVGQSEYSVYDNCVSDGDLMISNPNPGVSGSLAGKSTYTTFKNCYWNEEIDGPVEGTKMDECASYNKSTFVLSKNITTGGYTGDNLLEALNTAVDYYVLYEYSHWAYSIGLRDMEFTINGRSKHFYPDSQLFLLPGLSSDGSLTFDGWYTDEAYTTHLSEYIFTENTTIYGKWGTNTNTYTITFDTRGSSTIVLPVMGRFNSVVQLPRNVSREACTLGWWENDYGDAYSWELTVPVHNVTLHAVWGCTKISLASDLVGMAKIVKSGSSYKSEVVTLENDIVFTDDEIDQFSPIGVDSNANFEGIFDGHGHTISNLKLKTTSSKHGGMFGYSKGTTIRNLVMDSTCSVVSTYGSSTADEESFFGAFIGYCETYNDACILENSVNMASVTFNGDSSSNIFVGGFIGRFYAAHSYKANITNCVNYGTVMHIGDSNKYANLGGIAGGCTGENNGVFVRNCMNYGFLSSEGSSKIPCIGGITGYSMDKTNYENCVSIGTIFSHKTSEYIGTITGEIYSDSAIKHCYWDKKLTYNAVGIADSTIGIKSSFSFDTETFELSSTTIVGGYEGTSLIEALNNCEESDSNITYSKWALNKNMSTITFIIGKRDAPSFTLDSQIILIPNFTECKDEFFSGWFTDSNKTVPLRILEFTENTTLYGLFNNKKDGSDSLHTSNYVALNVVVVVVIILCIAIIAAIIGLILWTKFGYKVKARKEIQEIMDPLVFDRPENSIERLDLYPPDYKTLTLKRALINAGIEEIRAEGISSICYRHADNLLEEKKLPRGVTLDDAAAIALYTMEADNLEQNPYRLINEALMKGELEALEPVKDLLCLVMRALRKMPVVYNKPLYRGIRSVITSQNSTNGGYYDTTSFHVVDSLKRSSTNDPTLGDSQSFHDKSADSYEEDYLEGEEILWSALSSTSPNVAVTKAFLAKGSLSGKAEGTLFIIEDGWGYNVQPCSMFPGEEEIVLEPERRLRVKTVIPGEGLTVIKMEMLRTPLVLPDVFGEKNFGLFSTNVNIDGVDHRRFR